MEDEKFADFLKRLTDKFTPVVHAGFIGENYIPVDLSEANKELNDFDINSSYAFENYINTHLEKNKGKVAYGGYLEKRAIYNRSPHFLREIPDIARNIHIGLDLWCNAETEVLAPLDGVIHSFKDNDQLADYGPTIVIEHKIDEVVFFTLYGHLSRKSIQNISVGQLIKRGQVFARLGKSVENGDYAPHLHFQIIKDLQNKEGDYPGVSSKRDLEFYKQNCPDPNLLLKI